MHVGRHRHAAIAAAKPVEGLAKISAGKRVVKMKLPYFTVMLDSLALEAVPGLGTFGVTEHLVLIYDPGVLAEWTLRKVAFVIAHEGMHVFHKHNQRAKRIGISPNSEDAMLWNVCADAWINRILLEVFGWIPDDAVLPKDLGLPDDANMTTEEAFVLLRKKRQQQRQQQGGGGGGGQGSQDGQDEANGSAGGGGEPGDDSASDGQRGGSGKERTDQGQGGHNEGEGPAHGKACGGWCGSGAGRKLPNEPAPDHPASRNPGHIERIVRQVAEQIQAEASKHAGTVPGGLLRSAEELLKPPKIPWRTRLRTLLRSASARTMGAVDSGYFGVSRRQAGVGYGHGAPVLPKFFAPVIKVDFVVDTSGSMSQTDLGAAMREGQGILRAVGADVWFTAIDRKVHTQKRVGSIKSMLKLLKGGGGTSFIPYFESLKKRKKSERPNIVVFATDGYGHAPDYPPPGIKVIWLLIGHSQKPDTRYGPCKWGSFVKVED